MKKLINNENLDNETDDFWKDNPLFGSIKIKKDNNEISEDSESFSSI